MSPTTTLEALPKTLYLPEVPRIITVPEALILPDIPVEAESEAEVLPEGDVRLECLACHVGWLGLLKSVCWICDQEGVYIRDTADQQAIDARQNGEFYQPGWLALDVI